MSHTRVCNETEARAPAQKKLAGAAGHWARTAQQHVGPVPDCPLQLPALCAAPLSCHAACRRGFLTISATLTGSKFSPTGATNLAAGFGATKLVATGLAQATAARHASRSTLVAISSRHRENDETLCVKLLRALS
jgi:hypothetical protein